VLDLSEAPEAVKRLARWLELLDFETGDHQADGVNNQFARFVSGPLCVGLTADRGEWSFNLGIDEMSMPHSPDGWEASDGGFPLSGDPSDVNHQVGFAIERWLKAVDKARSDIREAEREIQAWSRIGSFGESPGNRPDDPLGGLPVFRVMVDTAPGEG
jgi:hypothetical protein